MDSREVKAPCGCIVTADHRSGQRLAMCGGGGFFWVTPEPELNPETRVLETCSGGRAYKITAHPRQVVDYSINPTKIPTKTEEQ